MTLKNDIKIPLTEMAGVHKEVFNQKIDLRHPSSGI